MNFNNKKNNIISLVKNKIQIGLIVRCKNEAYVKEFVDYYLNQGIDKIYILDDNSKKNIYNEVIKYNNVEILFSTDNILNPHESPRVSCLYFSIKDLYDWIIYVDMDEYITTKKNINKTIRDELETTFKDYACIKIPWVMMSCNSIEKNPSSLLQTNIYRWNHDKTHENKITNDYKFSCKYNVIDVKCIFKPKFFKNLTDHHPILKDNIKNCNIVDSINKTPFQKLNAYYQNLREKDIENGFLLCYHYRIISIENCLNKIKYNYWYHNYKLEDLMSNDYPEVIDETLKNKSIKNK
jgi:hypothetical protein